MAGARASTLHALGRSVFTTTYEMRTLILLIYQVRKQVRKEVMLPNQLTIYGEAGPKQKVSLNYPVE